MDRRRDAQPSRQFRRIIGYRDLAKLAVAVEREIILAQPMTVTFEPVASVVTVS